MIEEQAKRLFMIDAAAKLEEFIKEECRKKGFTLLDLSVKGQRNVSVEVVLDREGGISLEQCGDLNRDVSCWLEQENILGQAFSVDVCSPGLDRPLKKTADFRWAGGREIKVRLYSPIDGKNCFIGKLAGVNEDQITVMQGEDVVEIQRDIIAGARLWLENNVVRKKEKKPTKRSKKKK